LIPIRWFQDWNPTLHRFKARVLPSGKVFMGVSFRFWNVSRNSLVGTGNLSNVSILKF
jgi:hypothetical protein